MSKKKEISEEVRNSLKSIGLNDTNIENYSKNEQTVQNILDAIKDSKAKDLVKVGTLLVLISTKCKPRKHRAFLAGYIGKGLFLL
jgi:hypothetical protein